MQQLYRDEEITLAYSNNLVCTGYTPDFFPALVI